MWNEVPVEKVKVGSTVRLYKHGKPYIAVVLSNKNFSYSEVTFTILNNLMQVKKFTAFKCQDIIVINQ